MIVNVQLKCIHCYTQHIVAPMSIIEVLPTDILRRLAGESYRTWKLLCLSSTTLAARLGSYHRYKGIYIVCEMALNLPFEVFEGALVKSMGATVRGRDDCFDTLELTTEVIIYDSDGEDDSDNTVLGTSVEGCNLLEWNGHTLRVAHGGTMFIIARADSPCSMRNIYVKDELYCMSYPTHLTPSRIYEWIYNELPALFSVISVWKRIQLCDIVDPHHTR